MLKCIPMGVPNSSIMYRVDGAMSFGDGGEAAD